MTENFFADYKKFIVVPEEEKRVGTEVFAPENYSAHYILTLSIFDTRLSTWNDAGKFEIDIEKSIKTVLEEFNQKQHKKYHLQLLELDKFTNYFILALSCKTKFEQGKETDSISHILDTMLMNPFYVGQKWFNLIGEKGKVERKLFCYSFKEYKLEDKDHSTIEGRYDNVSQLIPKNGEISLIKSSVR
ncbi:hypothetical protein [Neobacillus kokaensis]|uniref:Uncharacterized protein n=1 Tax=Neobacillus kokaensis TaxID=2759023 RepID=A0ABQ3NB19_9BACI|nr:hypothetical protein [Neobacillus kokaensis]GHI01106.1 hypothetical protein AM1BK_46480 [Neobacillus kokaensis]